MWWTPGFPPDIGGIERLAALVLPELSRRGADVLLVANTADTGFAEVDHRGVPVVRIPSRRALATRDLALIGASKRRVMELKAGFRPDIVHVHLPDPSVQLHLTTATPGTRTVATIHSHLGAAGAGDPTETLLGRAVTGADALTGVTDSVLPPELRRATVRDGRVVAVVPNGIVVGDDPPPPPEAPLVVLAIGRLIEAKGFDLAIRAFAGSRARERGARLRIVGDGPERESLQQIAADLDVEVTFTGPLLPAAVADEYRGASVVIMPSRRNEGQPLVAMEAAAAGRPVVGSRVPGVANVVDDSTGILVPVDDLDALAAALDELLGDADRRARLGTAARRRAVEEYSLDVCVGRYLELYRSVLEREPVW
jgi:glycogen(starch) synthase